MQRCLELALLGAGYTAPNPMVGAVLVHEGRVIGEGYHALYGKAHAEVNCLASVKTEDQHLIPQATIYVSLEPCAHYGKTPPCADLIIEKKIPRVVVGCRDPFPDVDGKGIEKLLAAGVEVTVGVLEKECIALNKRFFTFHTRRRPYILLKWAQSANGKIGAGTLDLSGSGGIRNDRGMMVEGLKGEESTGKGAGAAGDEAELLTGGVNSPGAAGDEAVLLTGEINSPGADGSRILISNAYSNRLVHKWRSEEAAILVGTNTALADDPALTVRLWEGPDPIRLVIDKKLRLPDTLRLFDGTVRTIVFNTVKEGQKGNLLYYPLRGEGSLVAPLVNALYELKILSVLVEGGTLLLQSFIDEGYWDEARVITNNELEIPDGLAAPILRNTQGPTTVETLLSDTIRIYYRSTERL